MISDLLSLECMFPEDWTLSSSSAHGEPRLLTKGDHVIGEVLADGDSWIIRVQEAQRQQLAAHLESLGIEDSGDANEMKGVVAGWEVALENDDPDKGTRLQTLGLAVALLTTGCLRFEKHASYYDPYHPSPVQNVPAPTAPPNSAPELAIQGPQFVAIVPHELPKSLLAAAQGQQAPQSRALAVRTAANSWQLTRFHEFPMPGLSPESTQHTAAKRYREGIESLHSGNYEQARDILGTILQSVTSLELGSSAPYVPRLQVAADLAILIASLPAIKAGKDLEIEAWLLKWDHAVTAATNLGLVKLHHKKLFQELGRTWCATHRITSVAELENIRDRKARAMLAVLMLVNDSHTSSSSSLTASQVESVLSHIR